MEKKSSSDRNSLEYKWKVRASASLYSLLCLSMFIAPITTHYGAEDFLVMRLLHFPHLALSTFH